MQTIIENSDRSPYLTDPSILNDCVREDHGSTLIVFERVDTHSNVEKLEFICSFFLAECIIIPTKKVLPNLESRLLHALLDSEACLLRIVATHHSNADQSNCGRSACSQGIIIFS